MREVVLERVTKETAIELSLNLDQRGENDIATGIGFFDHMLNLFAFRAGVTLCLSCRGDLSVDGHHTVEDVGLTLGQAIAQALGDKSGIRRYGQASLPMDESLANCALDLSGRPYLVFNATFPAARVGVSEGDPAAPAFETELAEEFFRAVSSASAMTLHLNLAYGRNTHHMIEAIFKAFGCAFGQAIERVGEGVSSTKGVL